MKMIDQDVERLRSKARMLRFKKPAVKGLTASEIWNNLVEWNERCGEVEWVTGSADQTGIDALAEELGSLDDAYELMTEFNGLDQDIQKMMSDIQRTDWLRQEEEAEEDSEVWIDEANSVQTRYKNTVFDDLMALSGIADCDGFAWMGYDAYEEDYFGITAYEGGIGADQARERLKKLTKDKLLDNMQMMYGILLNYINVQQRYERLETAFDLLHDKYGTTLQTVSDIEKQWLILEKHRDNPYGDLYKNAVREINHLAEALPQEAWLE